jgi:peptidyl-prolyl cis-trans isomerase B (cyclophilin B)
MRRLLVLLALGSLGLAGCSPSEPGASATAGSSESATSSQPKTEALTEEPKEEAPSGATGKADDAPLPTKPKDGEEVAVLDTDAGQIVVMFYPQRAPNHVDRFKKLAKEGFYDGTRFHRCIPGFMIQGGDPKTKNMSLSSEWGTGGYEENGQPSNLKAEFNDIKHVKGVLSAARSMDPDSASSQFFLMDADAPSLDGQYSAFGMIVKGQDVVSKIVVSGQGRDNGVVDPAKAHVLKKVTIRKWPL